MRPFVVDSFPGIRANDSMDGDGAAVCNDVDLGKPGVVRNRAGLAHFSTADSGAYTTDALRLVDGGAVSAGHIYAITTGHFHDVSSGAVATATVTKNTGLGVDGLVFGTPTIGNRMYVTDSNGMRYWTGAAFTNLGAATTPRGGFLALQSREGRIVCAYSAINATPVPSRVHFSNPSTSTSSPETWGATDFVDISPGDGEVITGICSLGDLVVVFKQTRAFVFYGNSTSSTGTTTFNYRPVNLGDKISAGNLNPGRFSSDGESIYYVASRGVYRMSGEAPQLISRNIQATFDTGQGITLGAAFAQATQDKVYVGDGAGALKVLEKTTGEWVNYTSLQVSAMLAAGTQRAAYAYNANSDRLDRYDPTLDTDYGGTLTGSYTTSLLDCGSPYVKRLRQCWVVGTWSGLMSIGANADILGSNYTAVATPMATYTPQRVRTALQGNSFTLAVQATGTWSVSRLGLDISGERVR